MSDNIPKSVWQGSFRIFGVDIRCHVLSNGMRIIEEESFTKLFEKMAEANEVDQAELEAEIEKFARWQRGEDGIL